MYNNNSFMNRMERKFSKFAISNLTIYILAAYGIGYLLAFTNSIAYDYLTLVPSLVMRGQVWRLLTWVCTIPQSFSIFIIFMFMFFYWIGSSLERYLGTFRYNIYIFSGIFFMTLGSMLIYWITGFEISPSTYYINMSSFFAFALCFPDMQVLFMAIIPIKVKWLALVDAVYIAYEFMCPLGITMKTWTSVYSNGAEIAWSIRISIILSILNFAVFFLTSRNFKNISYKEVKRKKDYKKKVNSVRNHTAAGITKHKCAICGRTDEDDPNLTFRFCSKCDGNYEYCQDHLFTHEHIKK